MREIKLLNKKELNDLAKNINKELNGLGFSLFIYRFNESGKSQYISNGRREDMIKAIREKLYIFENNLDSKEV